TISKSFTMARKVAGDAARTYPWLKVRGVRALDVKIQPLLAAENLGGIRLVADHVRLCKSSIEAHADDLQAITIDIRIHAAHCGQVGIHLDRIDLILSDAEAGLVILSHCNPRFAIGLVLVSEDAHGIKDQAELAVWRIPSDF